MARAVWLLALVVALVACDEDGSFGDLKIGTLVVEVLTTGTDSLDVNGYAIDIDAGVNVVGSQINDTTSVDLFEGSHSVLLSDVAPQCAVGPANPQSILIEDKVTTNLSFAVTCP